MKTLIGGDMRGLCGLSRNQQKANEDFALISFLTGARPRHAHLNFEAYPDERDEVIRQTETQIHFYFRATDLSVCPYRYTVKVQPYHVDICLTYIMLDVPVMSRLLRKI